MLKQIRIIFSVILIAMFFVSTFIFSNQAVRACPPRIPATLLSLYLHSDLIILADYENERIIKKDNESEHGFYANLERNLKIRKVYKGDLELKQVSYLAYEYRQAVTPANNSERINNYGYSGYGTSVPVKIGGQYLFFLRSNGAGTYNITDNLGGVKNADETLGIYEENFTELASIAQNKESQLANVTEWLIKALEEPVTRWGAIQDLYFSSNTLAYERTSADDKTTRAFVLDNSFNTYSSVIAKNLNDAQKARIANLLSEEIQRSWFGKKPERTDYRLAKIVSTWDKSRLAIESFSLLQGLDETKFETKLIIMEFISNITEDNQLRDDYYQYSRIKSGSDPLAPGKDLTAANAQMQQFNNRFQTLLIQDFKPLEMQ